ncbi:MAG: KaiC family ATPase implicated in signal transduction [Candidatus Methanohalarchaeum thermophilum]|uniref:KaiC family ATPase implicated in signal transduction n=1 Tax=Methanohalarchaeum thermophilum TaxID=1903181 RepID=A0A1Q6DVY7_METT1|nr:MAG: KaiC family ATPase implicated in signal transduction [Candidatus Methanohalarchaeum thermophilum]
MVDDNPDFTGSEEFPFDEEELSEKAPKDRVPTGIEGFDDLCAGGLLKGRSYLLSGNAGAGKSIFATQFLYNGAKKYDEPGIYVTTEETPTNIRENMKNFGVDLKELEEENKLAIVDASAAKIGIPSDEKYVEVQPFDMQSLINKIIDIQEEIGAERCIIDSTTSLAFSIEENSDLRIELLKLSSTLGVLGLTSLMIAEVSDSNEISRYGIEEFVTEGVIRLYYQKKEGIRVRSVEIYKMRGSDHSKKIHPFEITEKGIKVHPTEEVYYF